MQRVAIRRKGACEDKWSSGKVVAASCVLLVVVTDGGRSRVSFLPQLETGEMSEVYR